VHPSPPALATKALDARFSSLSSWRLFPARSRRGCVQCVAQLHWSLHSVRRDGRQTESSSSTLCRPCERAQGTSC